MARQPSTKGRREQILGDATAADPDDIPEWDGETRNLYDGASPEHAEPTPAPESAEAGEPKDVPQSFQNFIEWLGTKAVETDADTYAAMADLVAEMSAASDPRQVLSGGYPMHAGEVVDRPFIADHIRIREGIYEDSEGLGFYAVLFGRFADTGDDGVITCGGKRVMAKIWALDTRDAWPISLKIVERKRKDKPPVMDLLPGD